ncbi:hypothetical protein [Photorhabdus laumondii]
MAMNGSGVRDTDSILVLVLIRWCVL